MSKTSNGTENLSPLKRAYLALEKAQARLAALERSRNEGIAVVGMACRFPGGVNTLDQYWHLLCSARDGISEVPANRWDVDALYDPDPDAPGKIVSRSGGFVDEVERFDPEFFGIAPREAMTLDPQQRLLLEVSHEALEDAGIAAERLARTAGGVFVGICGIDYSKRITRRDPKLIDAYIGTGNGHSVAAGRLSYFFGLQGPSVAIDTACSSSLVAAHLACQALRGGECEMALAGGVNLLLDPELSINFSRAHMLAPDGRCKTFDASADGYVRGEGCGIVVLKRLSDAIAAGDRILAVIRGSAVNQDGPSSGLTVPNGPAQQDVIRRALAAARVRPDEVGYIEAHGTGTSLGDPIEMGALGAVFGAREDPLWVASVKTNVGHLEAAAGVAGLIKVVLALQHEQIPPHLHFEQPSTHIPWKQLPVRIPTEAEAWRRGESRRLAGVSSFAFNGTNAHVLLEEAPVVEQDSQPERPCHLLPLSAKSLPAVGELAESYAKHLNTPEQAPLSDVCFTAGSGRSHFAHRVAVVAETAPEARRRMEAFVRGERDPGVYCGESNVEPGKVAFLFSGQGSQYVGMGRQLYDTEPTFRREFDRCEEILRDHLQLPLREVVYPAAKASSPLDETAYTQPALFALEYALARVWQSWGIRPSVLIGHSVGEYAAACLAGVFSLEDGLKLIAARARLMQDLPRNGQMVAVFAEESRVSEALAGHERQVAVAAVNGPRQVVISGSTGAVDAVLAKLSEQQITTRRLKVSHAFHSPLIEPMLDEFRRVAETIDYRRPQVKLVTNLTGTVAGEEIARAEHWCEHVRRAVRFAEGTSTLFEEGVETFVEVGPQSTLLGLARSCWEAASRKGHPRWLGSLSPKRPDWHSLLESLAELYVSGQEIDWVAFDAHFAGQKIPLPTYPFQRQRYWLEPSPLPGSDRRLASERSVHPLLGHRVYSAAAPELVQFESHLSAEQPEYLQDHCIWDTPVLPGMGYLETALAAGRELHADGRIVVEDVSFDRALRLPGGEVRIAQVILTPEGSGHRCELLSRTAEEDEQAGPPRWTLHAAGQVGAASDGEAQPEIDLDELKRRCDVEVSTEDLYGRLSREALHYGPYFQGLKRLWRGDWEVLGLIELPEGKEGGADEHLIHPAMLDSCLHGMAGLLDLETGFGRGGKTPFLPVGLKRLRLYAPAGPAVWSHVKVFAEESDLNDASEFTADLHLLRPDGRLVAVLEGLHMRRVDRSMLLGGGEAQLDQWLYELEWQESSLEGETAELEPGAWLLLADGQGVAEALAEELLARDQRCVLASPGETYEVLDVQNGQPAQYRIRPERAEDFQRLLEEAFPAGAPPLCGVVHLWSIGLKDGQGDAFSSSHRLSCGSTLHLVQALSSHADGPRLWLVTRGGQSVHESSGEEALLAQAPLWGLGRVIALEHTDLHCTRVDLDPQSQCSGQVDALLVELTRPGAEDQLAYRGARRYAARLVRFGQRRESGISLPRGPYRLQLTEYGVLDGLVAVPEERRAPEPGEVEIAVSAAALNFRDVLRALGMLAEYERTLGITSASQVRLGFECAGKITALGQGVEHLSAGDEVLAVVYGSMASHVTVSAQRVAPRPESLSAVEAATIPMAFLTAGYALQHLAALKPGDRVLIHAASGGVGQAAVQLARAAGAEVFATASPGKWHVLKSQGVRHVMNSRTLDFREQVLEATSGQGVDVVLNSLTGEFIPASLATLRKGGCFVEVGKLGIWDRQQMAAERPDVEYFAFDLDREQQRDAKVMSDLLSDCLRRIDAGELEPLPHRTFGVRQAVDAFRFMAQTRHVGKVVLTMSDETAPREQAKITADATYLITGGLGGLGLQVARWLVDRGARHLVLTSRSGPKTDEQRQAIEQLGAAGADARVVRADVASGEDVQRLLDTIRTTLPPLRGVIHAAGVVDDGMLVQQDWSRFQRVMRPKVAGAWHLHRLTQDLDFFVVFASGVGLLGTHGQGNYAAANAFLDALAQHRQALGLPGLAIDWGPWDELGMTARLTEADRARMSDVGLLPIPLEQGLEVFGRLLRQSMPQVAAMLVDWNRLGASMPSSPLWAGLARASGSRQEATPAKAQELQQAPPGERLNIIVEHVRAEVAAVLGWNSAERVGPRQKLFDLGMDSLTSVELRHRLERSLGCSLPVTVAFDYSTAEAMAGFLLEQLNLPTEEEEPEQEESEEFQQQAERLAEMSDEEVESLLADKLKDLL